jgi:hypothetical protein
MLQTPPTFQASQPPSHSYQGQYTPQAPQSPQSKNNDFSRQLALLNKIYKEEDKFSDTDSNFDMKAAVFYDKCRRVGLPEHAYIQSASIMLSDQALTHYYSNQMSYT